MVYDADLNEGFFDSLRYLNKYYGITQNPITKDFIIIMKYYRLGSLKDYIAKNFYNIKWNEKLKILRNIVAGLKHLQNQNNDIGLIIEICDNFRPSIIKNTPKGYNELMQECWNSDPNKRPTTYDI